MLSPLFRLVVLGWLFGGAYLSAQVDSVLTTASPPVERTLSGSERHAYFAPLRANYYVRGSVNQISIDIAVRVFRPDGSQLGSFDQPARGPEPFSFVTDTSGVFKIEIVPYLDTETGRYAIQLLQHEPAATTPEGRVDQLMSPVAGGDTPGAQIAVLRNGQLLFSRGYGMANLEYGAPIEPETVFHVASVSKQFTAFAIAKLAQDGALSLDDDVRIHLPELADFGSKVTLRQLIHHTSGMRDQWTLWALAGGRLDDVITQKALLRLVAGQDELNFEPGSEHLYSNSGYMLLAEVVARVSGVPFGQWLRENVFEPLDMRHTQVYDDHERLVAGRAYSYYRDPTGTFKKSVLSYANAGATSLFTTAEDLVLWLDNFRSAIVGGQVLIAQMQERGVLAGGDTLRYAFGIEIDTQDGWRRMQHSGGDAGFRSFVAFYPEDGLGVAVLSNLADFAPAQIAALVANAYLPSRAREADQTEPSPGSEVVNVPASVLAPYAGFFEVAGLGEVLEFIPRGTQMTSVDGTGTERFLRATSDSSFVWGSGSSVVFHRTATGQVQSGAYGDHPMSRVPAWSPSPTDLSDYAGTYWSPELETTYHVVVRDSGLVATHLRCDDIDLRHKRPDRFVSDRWYFQRVKFERDAEGSVSGMRVSSWRVRDAWFERMRR